MNSALTIRIISAVVFGLLIIIMPYLVWGATGLFWTSMIAASLAILEFSFIVNKIAPSFVFLSGLYSLCVLFLFWTGGLRPGDPYSQHFWGGLFVTYSLFAIWFFRRRDIGQLFQHLSVAALGFLYCGLLPVFAIRLLQLPAGALCFFSFLTIIFTGDSFAYFGGKWFGKEKIYRALSENKTWAGSISGFLGSVIGAVVCWTFFLRSLPIAYLLGVGLLMGLVGQTGDLFVSLLKRSAKLKDSGRLMPGHGGILDRLDGVFFAAPLFYILVEWGYHLI